MKELPAHTLATGSNEQVIDLLSEALSARLPSQDDPQFIAELRKLPIGLRAMAATHGLDVSLTMDDLGWHFGNWHSHELAQEAISGLRELGATELAALFEQAYAHALTHWSALEADNWTDWYHGSPLEEAVMPLNEKAWALLEDRWNGIFSYWVEYAKRYPEKLGAAHDA